MDTDRYTNLSSETLVLIDANDPDIDWDAITVNIRAWMLAIGKLCPMSVQAIGLEEGDIPLLLSKARMLVADREDYQGLAIAEDVTFVPAWGRPASGVVDSIDRHWHG